MGYSSPPYSWNTAVWNSALAAQQLPFSSCVWARAAVPASLLFASKMWFQGRAWAVLQLCKAAWYGGGSAVWAPAQWGSGLRDRWLPSAEGHVDGVLAADVPFLYYSRLNDSLATVCCNKGLWDRGVSTRLSFSSWHQFPYSKVQIPVPRWSLLLLISGAPMYPRCWICMLLLYRRKCLLMKGYSWGEQSFCPVCWLCLKTSLTPAWQRGSYQL